MLLKYIVSNYKSIGHEIEFSMLPTAEDTDERFISKIQTKQGEMRVLHRGILLGTNASGKSTFIDSIRFAKDLITNERRSGRMIPLTQFRGCFMDLKALSTFQFLLYLNGEVYDYGFTVSSAMIREEWLMQLDTDGFHTVFERETDTHSKTQIHMTDRLAEKDSNQRKLAEILASGMQQNQRNQLFLYRLYDNSISSILPVFEWFDKIQVIFPNSQINNFERAVSAYQDFSKDLSAFLSGADTGIKEVILEKQDQDIETLLKQIGVPDNLVQKLYQTKHGTLKLGNRFFNFNEENGELKLIEVKFQHILNGKEYTFEKSEESDGTQRLLDLFPILYENHRRQPHTYFIDELDRSLHTALTTKILDNFIQDAASSSSQIILTAHDVNLLDFRHFSQSEFWFFEKTEKGETKINPFSNFDIANKGYDVVRAYLSGRFGAVPYFKEEF